MLNLMIGVTFFFKKEIVNFRKASFTLNELMTFKGKIPLHYTKIKNQKNAQSFHCTLLMMSS